MKHLCKAVSTMHTGLNEFKFTREIDQRDQHWYAFAPCITGKSSHSTPEAGSFGLEQVIDR